jgi:cytochrome c oxidase subunit 2
VLLAAPSILDPAGPEAHHLAGLWWLLFALAAVVYVVVAGFVIGGVLRGRATEAGKPSRISDGAFVVLGGLVVPVLILMVVAVATVQATTTVRQPEKGALRVEVVAHDWWWEVRYPDRDIVTANEIHIPVGRQVTVGLHTGDVVHSFWVPQLAGKLDTIPGQRNELRLEADRAGVYRGECAEFCGLQHANMNFLVIAQPAAEFERWAVQQARPVTEPAGEEEARGRQVFERESCAGCHTMKGTSATGRVGPDLTHFGSRRTIGAATVDNTPANLTQWISDSQTIKPGNLMPPLYLSGPDLKALIAYLESQR